MSLSQTPSPLVSLSRPSNRFSLKELVVVSACFTFSGTAGLVAQGSQSAGRLTEMGSAKIGQHASLQAVTFTVPGNVTLGKTVVRTNGVTGLDFTEAPGSTCAGSVLGGMTCVVQVAFTPAYPGARVGAVTLMSATGQPVATSYVRGHGTGPQIVFGGATATAERVTSLTTVTSIAVDGANNTFLADPASSSVEHGIGNAGARAHALKGRSVRAVALGAAGELYSADKSSVEVATVPLGCATPCTAAYVTVATVAAGLRSPEAITVDASGDVYIADTGNNRILKETPSGAGYIETVVASDLAAPRGVAVDEHGTVYVANTGGNNILALTATGAGYRSSVFATGLSSPGGMAIDGTGNLYVADSGAQRIVRESLTSRGYVQELLTKIPGTPQSVTLDLRGNVYAVISNQGEMEVSKINLADAPTYRYTQNATDLANVAIQNIGNANLTIATSAAQDLPRLIGPFTLAGSTTCPLPGAAIATLAPGSSCVYSIAGGTDTPGVPTSGKLVIGDDSLGVEGATQIVELGKPLPTPEWNGQSLTFFDNTTGSSSGASYVGDSISLSLVLYSDTGSNEFNLFDNGSFLGTYSMHVSNGNMYGSVTLTAGSAGSHNYELDIYYQSCSWGCGGNWMYTGNYYNYGAYYYQHPQTITFSPLASPVDFGSAPVTLSATGGGSGNPVTFSVTGPATLSGSTLTYTGTGVVTVTASQQGNTYYSAAPAVSQTVSVVSANAGSSNFGNQAVGTTSSSPAIFTFTFVSTVTLNSTASTAIQVLTQGSPNLDFKNVAGGTCAAGATYTSGQSCTVKVSFTPSAPGARIGGVLLLNSNSVVIGTGLANGTGIGALATFNLTSPVPTTPFVPTGASSPYALAFDGAGNIYIANSTIASNIGVSKFSSTGASLSLPTGGATFVCPRSITVDGPGNVFVADPCANAVISFPAGGGSPAYYLTGITPYGVAVDGAGNLYVSTNSSVIKVAPSTMTQTTLDSGYQGTGIALDSSGNVYVSAPTLGPLVEKIPAAGGSHTAVTTTGVILAGLAGLAMDAANNLYIIDTQAQKLYEVPAAGGAVTTLASGIANVAGIAVNPAGSLYYAVNTSPAAIGEIARTPPSLTFPNTPVGSTSNPTSGSLRVENDGTANLVFTGLSAPAPFAVLAGSSPYCSTGTAVVAQGSCTLLPQFIPTSSGAASANATVADNSLTPAQLVPLTGTGLAAPVAAVTAVNSPFGSTVGVTVTATEIGSAGVVTGGVVTFSVAGSATGTFSPTTCALSSAGTCSVTFTPTGTLTPGTYSNGISASIAANNFYTAAVASSNLNVTAQTTVVGSTTGTLVTSVTITTAGTPSAINVLTQGATGLDFNFVSGGTCSTGTVYSLGQTCTVQFSFAPGAPGIRKGAITLTTGTTVLATAYISGTGNGAQATMSPGLISTVAGNGTAATAGDGGAATAASINGPRATAVDGAGNLYIGGYDGGGIVRKVSAATGIITTYAGGGTTPGSCAGSTNSIGDGCVATSASIAGVDSLAIDGAGNVYIADEQNGRIRKVTPAGLISTVAGGGSSPGSCSGFTDAVGDGCLSTSASFSNPSGVAVDGAGNLYIADQSNGRIREVIASTGMIATVAGNGSSGYTAAGDNGAGAATATNLNAPSGVTVDGAGNLYIADKNNQRIRYVSAATGFISTVAGNGTPAFSGDGAAAKLASINYASAVQVDAAGNLYITDTGNSRIRKVAATSGFIATVAGYASTTYAAAQDTGTTPATSASLHAPYSSALDSAGNLYIADESNNRVRKVSVIGEIVFPTATAAATSDSTDGTQTTLVNNIGNLPLTFTSQVVTGTSFTLANPNTGGCSTAISVAAGGSCLLGATFAPVAGSSGPVAGRILLTDNSLSAGTTQSVPLAGSTSANAAFVTVGSLVAVTGSASVTLQFTLSYMGALGDTGAVSITVNGSATGVGTVTCLNKALHKNCTFPYTGSALATAGSYPIVVSMAADTTYTAASAAGTLSVSASGAVAPIGAPVSAVRVAMPFSEASPSASVTQVREVQTVQPMALAPDDESSPCPSSTKDASAKDTAKGIAKDTAKVTAKDTTESQPDCRK